MEQILTMVKEKEFLLRDGSIPLRNGQGVVRRRLGPCFIYLDLCLQNSNCIFLSLHFVGKLKECSVLQFRLKLQTHQAVWFSGSEKGGGALLWHSCILAFQHQKKLYSMKEKCICWEGTWMLKTHCYYKSQIWDTVHNVVVLIVQF